MWNYLQISRITQFIFLFFREALPLVSQGYPSFLICEGVPETPCNLAKTMASNSQKTDRSALIFRQRSNRKSFSRIFGKESYENSNTLTLIELGRSVRSKRCGNCTHKFPTTFPTFRRHQNYHDKWRCVVYQRKQIRSTSHQVYTRVYMGHIVHSKMSETLRIPPKISSSFIFYNIDCRQPSL